MNDQTIYEGVATSLTTNSFTAPSGYYFAGWNTAQNGTGTTYSDGQSVTDLTTAGNTITLYAQWTDCPGGKICYNANVSNPNDVEGEMGNQTVSNSATSAVLYAPNFKRSNYGFTAWNTKPDGSGTNYGPNQTIEFTAGAYSTGGLKLYAKWLASAGNMQNWTCPNDTDMPIGTVTALKDTRDNNVYAVAKLVDGKCWMIENLRLDDSAILTSSNTHNPSLPLTNNYSASTTSNHLSPTTNPYQNAWCKDYNESCIDQSVISTNNTTLFINNTASNYNKEGDVYGYGNYYNWYSATAGHGKYSKSSGNVAGDICPAGWHLPTGEKITDDFQVLDIALGGAGHTSNSDTNPNGQVMYRRWISYPNNFISSGFATGPEISGRNATANYWTSTTYNNSYVYDMHLSRDYVRIGEYNEKRKFHGLTVRCIAGT